MDETLLGVAALVLAVVAIFAFAVSSHGVQLPQAFGMPGSLTINSISLTTFDSNDISLQGQAWLVSATAGGNAGDYLVGYVGKADSPSSGATRKYDVELDAQRIFSSCIYTPSPSQTDLFKLTVKWKNCVNPLDPSCQARYLSTAEAKSNCLGNGGAYYLEDFYHTGYCYSYSKVGATSTFDQNNINLDWKVAINIKSSGQTGSAYLYPTSTYAVLNNGLGSVKWSGNKIGSQLCVTPSSIVMARNLQSGASSIADSSVIAKLGSPSHENSDVKNCLAGTGGYLLGSYTGDRLDLAQACVAQQNNQVDAIFASDRATVNPSSAFYGARVLPSQISIDANMVMPDLSFKLAVSWLGIYQPVGKPVWTAVISPVKFTSDSMSYLHGTLQNAGDAATTINYWVECQGISVVDAQQSVALSPGQYSDVQVAVKGSNMGTTDSSFSCNLRARAANAADTVTTVVTGSLAPIARLTCNAPFILDYSTNTCKCPLAGQAVPAGEVFDATRCGFFPVPSACGNGMCDAGETKGTCSQDCGPPVCSDGSQLNSCSTVNKGMYCGTNAQLVSSPSCSITCDISEHYDSASGTCIKDWWSAIPWWVTVLAVVLLVAGAAAIFVYKA
jgi:hypothetical protein